MVFRQFFRQLNGIFTGLEPFRRVDIIFAYHAHPVDVEWLDNAVRRVVGDELVFHTTIGDKFCFSIDFCSPQGPKPAKSYLDLPALLRLTGADVTLIPAMLIRRGQHIRTSTSSAREAPRIPLGSRSQGRPAPCEAGAVTGIKRVVVKVVIIVVHTNKGARWDFSINFGGLWSEAQQSLILLEQKQCNRIRRMGELHPLQGSYDTHNSHTLRRKEG